MPAIGDRDFPATTIDTSVDSAKKIATQFKGAPFDRKALATALQYKSDKTGAFNQFLADIRRFGIVTGRGESLSATEVVQRLAVPKDEAEYSSAVIEVMNNVPLFRELYEHYQGVVPSEDDLLTTLINLSKADRVVVQGVVGRIRANLSSGWAKAGAYRPPSGRFPGGSQQRADHYTPPAEKSDIITVNAGKLHLQYPLTPSGIELMKLSFTGDGIWAILREQIPPSAEKPASEGGSDAEKP